MSSSAVVCKGKFAMELTPLDGGNISSQISSEGFEANATGFGIALGSLIKWFLDGCEKELNKTGHALDTIEKKALFCATQMEGINLAIVKTLATSEEIPPKGKTQ